MTTLPTLTPVEALARLRAKGEFKIGGHTYVLDGMMGTAPEDMWPAVIGAEAGDSQWVPNGEPGEPINDDSYWVEV